MNNSSPKYIVVKHELKEAIRRGEISDKLPGERILAANLGVAYMTVRKAVQELVEEGILHKLSTKGTFVSDRRMSPKATLNIGFFLDSGIKEGISSPYYSLIFKALESEVIKHGYNLILFSDANDLNPLNSQKKIDGVIICCFPRIEDKIQEIKKLLPIVLLDNVASDKSIPSVTIDNFNTCSRATDHVWQLGHQRIGFISGTLDSEVCIARLQGYKAALNAHNTQPEAELIYKGDYSYESGENAGKYYLSLDRKPTALICANDSMAIGAMKALQEGGLRIPEDISVVGFDDIEVSSRVYPSLTTNAAPIGEMAKLAIKMLLDSINGKDIDFTHTILPAELIERQSCKPLKK